MKRRSFLKYTSGSIACTLFPAFSRASAVSRKPLVMGIFPRRNPQLTFDLFTPLAEHLSETLNIPVRLETTRHFKDFWLRVKNADYDLLHYNQYHYILANQLFGHQVILKNHEYGSSEMAGAISVRKDSGIESINDLNNTTIMFGGGPMAMQSYIAPRWLLQQAGLSLHNYTEKFAINPPNAIYSVYNRQSDAAGSGDAVFSLQSVRSQIDISQMKYIARTRSLPHLPWAVNTNVSSRLKSDIKSSLSELRSDPSGHLVLDKARLTALIPAVDSEYNQHRDIIREVYGKSYGLEKFT